MAWTSSDLTVVETAIRNRLSGGAVESYNVQGLNLRYCSLDELRKLRDEIQREVNATTAKRVTKASFRYS